MLVSQLTFTQGVSLGHNDRIIVVYSTKNAWHLLSFAPRKGTICSLHFLAILSMFSGSMVALVTPMHTDGSVDYSALERLVTLHIDNKTDAIVSVGTSGESATLTHDENINVIKHTLSFAAGRVPIIAGTGSNSTAEAIEMTRRAHKAGADAALLVVPYYNKPEQAGLFLHFQAIAEAVAIPQILYNVPGRTSRNMENETTLKLAQISNIVGIKDATADMQAGEELIQRKPDDFSVWSGDDGTTLALMKLGGKGCISVTANVAPLAMHQMCAAALDGDFETAHTINQSLNALHTELFIEANPIPVKYAVSRMGLMQDNIRLPLTKLGAEHQAAVDDAMAHAGIST